MFQWHIYAISRFFLFWWHLIGRKSQIFTRHLIVFYGHIYWFIKFFFWILGFDTLTYVIGCLVDIVDMESTLILTISNIYSCSFQTQFGILNIHLYILVLFLSCFFFMFLILLYSFLLCFYIDFVVYLAFLLILFPT